METIKLQSADGEVFDTDVQTAKLSGTIRTMLDDCVFEDEEDGILPLRNVSSDILRRVLKWATYHKDDPINDDDENKERRTDDISPWDKEFFNVDQGN